MWIETFEETEALKLGPPLLPFDALARWRATGGRRVALAACDADGPAAVLLGAVAGDSARVCAISAPRVAADLATYLLLEAFVHEVADEALTSCWIDLRGPDLGVRDALAVLRAPIVSTGAEGLLAVLAGPNLERMLRAGRRSPVLARSA